MDCKHCGAPLNEEERICSQCGQETEEVSAEEVCDTAELAAAADSAEESVTAAEEETASEEEAAGEAEESTAEASAEEAVAEETNEASENEAPAKKNTGLIIAIAACLVVIAVLLAILISGKIKGQASEQTTGETVQQPGAAETVPGENAAEEAVFDPVMSYVVDDPAFFTEEVLANIVASCGDSTMDNEKLAYYYWREYYTFLSQYSTYVTYLMNPYGRLDQQESLMAGLSWDELFMQAAMESYHTYSAAASKAKAEGYTLSETEQAGIDNIGEEIGSYASLYGYESADGYLQASFGPYADLESYKEFWGEYILGASYLDSLLSQAEVTDENVLAYYEENKADYESNGLTYDDRPMVNIRHILIIPEAVSLSKDDPGYAAAEQAAKDTAKEQAQALYDQWLEGGMGEEAFAELAKANSGDGSAADGGMIPEIAPGQTVENFDAWCFAEGRQVGDHGLVETEFGYHLIYFSSFCEKSYWRTIVEGDYINSLYSEYSETMREEFPIEGDLTKAFVYANNIHAMDAASGQ